MKFNIIEVSIRDLTKNYINDNVEGVTGYNNQLDIRPKYQREFVYNDKQRNEVINTVNKGYPLSLLQWVKKSDDSYEVLDGQQRTISICEYVAGEFSVEKEPDTRYFPNLEQDEQDKILDCKLMIQVCEGGDSEKLDWFKIVNIAGEKLSAQELRNAVFSGAWLSDAKAYFSKPNCAAHIIASDYLKGSAIRQEYLETALKWISGGNIEQYMAAHQNTPNANELRLYFAAVIDWVKTTFPNYRKEMKGVDFGALYNDFKTKTLDTTVLETEISKLMADEDVTKKSGIYPYVLTRKEKYLSIRAFNDKMKREVYERQNGICTACNDEFKIGEMEADHITPWHAGGTTTADNCQMLCQSCNRTKSGK